MGKRKTTSSVFKVASRKGEDGDYGFREFISIRRVLAVGKCVEFAPEKSLAR